MQMSRCFCGYKIRKLLILAAAQTVKIFLKYFSWLSALSESIKSILFHQNLTLIFTFDYVQRSPTNRIKNAE